MGDNHSQQASLDAAWQQILPVTIGDDRYINLLALQTAVGTALYPDGIHNDAAYDRVTETATQLAAANGYAGEQTLRPPQVAFTAAGTYLKQVPTLDPALLTEESLGKPLLDSRSLVMYYTVQTARNEIAWALHDKPFNKLQPPVANLLKQQLDTAMMAAGWTLSQASGRPRYERGIRPKLDGLHETLVTWLQGRQGEVYRQDLIDEATRYAFGRAYRFTATTEPALQPVIDKLPAALTEARYETEAVGNYYAPRPLDLDEATTTRLTAVLDALIPVATKAGRLLPEEAVWKEIARVVGKATHRELEYGHKEQLKQKVLHPWLVRKRYNTTTKWVNGKDREPMQTRGVRGYPAEYTIVTDPGHVVGFGSGKTKALPVFAPVSIVDERNRTIVCLQLLGNLQAVKANWAKLMSSYQTSVELQGTNLRLRGMKQHIAIKKPLPMGQVDWVILHKQASVKEMQPDEDFYVLDNGTQPVPEAFFPMLDAALVIPMQPQWAETLWEAGRAQKLIQPVSERSYGLTAWRIEPEAEEWEAIVTASVRSGKLQILHDGKPLDRLGMKPLRPVAAPPPADEEDREKLAVFRDAEISAPSDMFRLAVEDVTTLFTGQATVPKPQAIPADTNLIHVYTVDDAVADGTHLDAGTMQSNGDPVPVVVPRVTKFSLGRIVVTQGAIALHEDHGISLQACLNRHAVCDWGDTDPSDCRANDAAVKSGDDRMLSVYKHEITEVNSEGKPKTWTAQVWIQTEWDRSATTVMTPGEY